MYNIADKKYQTPPSTPQIEVKCLEATGQSEYLDLIILCNKELVGKEQGELSFRISGDLERKFSQCRGERRFGRT